MSVASVPVKAAPLGGYGFISPISFGCLSIIGVIFCSVITLACATEARKNPSNLEFKAGAVGMGIVTGITGSLGVYHFACASTRLISARAGDITAIAHFAIGCFTIVGSPALFMLTVAVIAVFVQVAVPELRVDH